MVKVFVPKERLAGETRVAATPETVKRFIKEGLEVTIEAGAGVASQFPDVDYGTVGAAIATEAKEAYAAADLVLKVRPPSLDEVALLKPGSTLIGFLSPYDQPELVQALAERKVASMAMELVPRISRAQSMDALSSQANIGGYKAVLLAAARLNKYFPLLMTAAGTVKPARVVVMGAGVAGLQAIATAKRLGAVVEVSDIRPEVEEQVRSLGAKFIELPMKESGAGEGGYAKEMTADFLTKQREIVKRHLSNADVAITTALIPGKKAPLLISADMVEAMHPGAVIVDLAVEQGGNCELSRKDEEVVEHGVVILGPSNLPATMPHDASMLYARNHQALLLSLLHDGQLNLDREDEVVAGALLTQDGEVVHPRVAALLEQES